MTTPNTTRIPAIVILPSSLTNADADGENPAKDAAPMAKEPPKHASDLDEKQWKQVIDISSLLRAWKGQYNGENLSINRAPRAALRFKDPIPEFEVSDDSYTKTQESNTRIEREMTLKAFTESGIHAALSGGAHSLTFGLGGSRTWSNEFDSTDARTVKTTTVHGFYNVRWPPHLQFPRVVVYLEPDSLELSQQCINFFRENNVSAFKHDILRRKNDALVKFFRRFGGIIATRVVLGGRLCTAKEVETDQESKLAEERQKLRSKLTATLVGPGAGSDIGVSRAKDHSGTERVDDNRQETRLTIETQGGNALLASSIDDWTASVGTYQYWRVIEQSQPIELLQLLRAATEGTEHHEDVVALHEHLKAQAAVFGQLRANQFEMWVNSTYGSPGPGSSKFIFSFKMHMSRPEIVSLISVQMKITQYILEGRDRNGTAKVKRYTQERFKELPDIKSNLQWSAEESGPYPEDPEEVQPTATKKNKDMEHSLAPRPPVEHMTCQVAVKFFLNEGWDWDFDECGPNTVQKSIVNVPKRDVKVKGTLPPSRFDTTKEFPNWKSKGMDRRPVLQAAWTIDGQDRRDHLLHKFSVTEISSRSTDSSSDE